MTRRSLVVLAVAAVSPSAAFAHKMELKVTPADDRLRVAVSYEGGEPSDGTAVTIADAAGVTVAEETTDIDGVCVLPRPGPGTYTLTADDGAGHRVQQPLQITGDGVESADGTSPPAAASSWLTSLLGVGVIAAVTALAWWLRRKAG